MSDLKDRYNYILKLFEDNSITFDLTHDTGCKSEFMSDTNTAMEKFEYFIYYFMQDLVTYKRIDLDTLFGSSTECSECGKKIYCAYDTKRKVIYDGVFSDDREHLIPVECSTVEPYSFDITFPTGKVIVVDRLQLDKAWKTSLVKGCKTICSLQGCKEVTLAYATQNILHVAVGNTCPSLLQPEINPKQLFITNYSEEEEITRNKIQLKDVGICNLLSFICTDLWWASMLDWEVYEQLLDTWDLDTETKEEYKDSMREYLVTIPSGKYTVTCYPDRQNNYPMLFAKLEK